MAVISATAFLGIVTSSPKAGTFNLIDIVIFLIAAYVIGYSWLVCGQDHENEYKTDTQPYATIPEK